MTTRRDAVLRHAPRSRILMNGRTAATRRSAHDRLPITGGRRQSERIDLDFMPPPFTSVEQKGRDIAPVRSTYTRKRPATRAAFALERVIPGRCASIEPGIQRLSIEIPGSRFARPGMTGLKNKKPALPPAFVSIRHSTC